ncbi:hypothetical protein E3Q23_01350 [Wallemia mellicola]|nr:hypothetical protein E3Q23_01350 [Wallemia mellicola]
MDLEEFRKHGYDAVDRIYNYYKQLQENPGEIAVQPKVKPGYLSTLGDVPPQHGIPFDSIQNEFKDVVLKGLNHWQHPSTFHYFPSNTSFESMITEMTIASINNPGFSWHSNPSSELELVVMDWIAGLFGFSETFYHSKNTSGGGIIQPSSSEGILVAIIAARERILRAENTRDQSKLIIYASTQTHSSAAKAARVFNLKLRILDVDEDLSLRGETVMKAINEDRQSGLVPFVVIATIGTTSTGAIDKIDEIGRVCHSESLYLHIDSAWAGTHLACPELRDELMLDGINEFADSINIDIKSVTDALTITPAYLRNQMTDSGAVLDMKDCGIGLGRHFSSPKLYFMLKSYGVEGFRAHIRKSIGLGERFRRYIEADEVFEVLYKPRLSLTVFRLGGTGDLNSLNRTFYNNLSIHSDKLSLTHTVVNGVYCVRRRKTDALYTQLSMGIFDTIKGIFGGDSKPSSEDNKSVMQPPANELEPPKDTPITVDELKEHDGSNDKPIYVAIKGTVFDVTKKKEMYGSGQSYNIFAGKDGSRGLGMSSLDPEDAVSDYSTLSEKELSVLDARNIPKIVLTRPLMPEIMSKFTQSSRPVNLVNWKEDKPAPREWLLENSKDADALLVMLSDKVDKELLDIAGSRLKAVSTMSVGYDHCDLAQLKQRGIKLSNTPDLLTSATAETAALLYLAATRRAAESIKFVERGEWPQVGWGPLLMAGQLSENKTLGFLGFGRIAQATMHRLAAFGIKNVIYTDSGRTDKSERDAELSRKYDINIKRVDLDALAHQSDAVILLAAMSPDMKHIVGRDFLQKMKKTAVVINVARGPLVDTDALNEAINEGIIAGAGLDVIEGEPHIDANHPVVKNDKIFLLPHIGSSTVETRYAMADLTVTNAIKGAFGEEMQAQVKL